MAWNWGFAKITRDDHHFAKMSDSTMKAFTTVHSALLSIVSGGSRQCSYHFLAVLLEEAQRPPSPSLSSCGAKWMMDSADLEPCEQDALILLEGIEVLLILR